MIRPNTKYPHKCSIYLPADTYISIRNIAEHKRISMQDVMRAALDTFIAGRHDAVEQLPLEQHSVSDINSPKRQSA